MKHIVYESDAMVWHDAKTDPPTEGGRYLCIQLCFLDKHPYCDILSYSKNLSKLDSSDFRGQKRPGWYTYDGEWGYFEEEHVTHWMPLPDLPEELKRE